MSLLPSRSEAEPPEDAGPRVIGLDSDDADDVLAALSSETARSLLGAIHDEPAPPSELADRVDTSLQNAQYHLGKLEDAGAIEVVDTAYSAKGREMDVYAPADQPLVVFAGDEDDGSTLRAALSRLLGAVGVLAFASLAVQAAAEGISLPQIGFGAGGGDGAGDGGGDGAPSGGGDGGSGGADGGSLDPSPTPEVTRTGTETMTPTAEPTSTASETASQTATATSTPAPTPTETATSTATETATQTATETATQMADAAPDAAGGLPPGLVFFAGGLFAIAVVTAVLYVRHG